MNKPEENKDLKKRISFIQYDRPGLMAGDYEIEVSQEVKRKGETDVVNKDDAGKTDNFLTKSTFHVLGDRFSLSNPAETVYSLFPAENASGQYNNSFPHIVFKKSTFPWIRSPKKAPVPPIAKNISEQDAKKDIPVWMTLLLLDQDELDQKNKDVSVSIVTLKDLFPPSVQKESSLKDNYSYFHNKGSLDVGMKLADLVSVLDIKVSLFKLLAPSVADLKVMGHVRKVSFVPKATMANISDKGVDEGKFSIVFGNRLPSVNKRNTIFVVSLEGLEDFLPGSNSTNIDDNKMLRLAVLNTWSFYTNDQDGKFVDLMSRLNDSPGFSSVKVEGEGSKDIVNYNFDLTATLKYPPPPGANKVVRAILDRGYVPMNHDLRVGDNKTVSWYRGPLVPCEVTNRLNHWIDNVDNRSWATSEDELMIFDPSTGMLDLSYSVSWRLGKQLALQSKKTTDLIFKWTDSISKEMRFKIEDMSLNEKLNLNSSIYDNKPENNTLESVILSLASNID